MTATQAQSSAPILFIGLGVMGAPMAAHLVRGHCKEHVWGYNRSSERAQAWQQQTGAAVTSDPASIAAQVDTIISCVTDDHALAQMVSALEPSLRQDTLWIDHSTTSSSIALELQQRLEARGAHFVDAPVSGGQQGAQDGTLTVMMGAEASMVVRCEAVMQHYSKRITHVGPVGHGQLCKMVNQICIAGLLQALSEGLLFCERSGLDGKKAIEAISAGAAQSWQMNNRAHTMLQRSFDFGFAVELMCKDLDLCLEQAKIAQTHLPITALVRQYYAQLKHLGQGGYDTSSLINLL